MPASSVWPVSGSDSIRSDGSADTMRPSATPSCSRSAAVLASIATRTTGSGTTIDSSTTGASGAQIVSPPDSGKPTIAPISPASRRVTSIRSSAMSWTSRPTRSFLPARAARIVMPFSSVPRYTRTNVS